VTFLGALHHPFEVRGLGRKGAACRLGQPLHGAVVGRRPQASRGDDVVEVEFEDEAPDGALDVGQVVAADLHADEADAQLLALLGQPVTVGFVHVPAEDLVGDDQAAEPLHAARAA
jgi:hypothetical protein